MKPLRLKALLLAVLVLGGMVLLLGLGLWPWLQGRYATLHVEHLLQVMTAAAPTLELGALSKDPSFLEEPAARLLQQTGADFLAVYDLDGANLLTLPKTRDLPPPPADVLEEMGRDPGSRVRRSRGTLDLYVPVPNRVPLDVAMDETRIFFPSEGNTTTPATGERTVGILRLGLPAPTAAMLPPPTARDLAVLFSVLAVAVGLLAWIFWWALYRRLDPVHRGVNLLAKGNYAHQIPRPADADLALLVEGINTLARRLEQTETRIQELAAGAPRSEGGWTDQMLRKMADDLASPAGFLFMNLYKLLEYITGLLKVLNAYNRLKLSSQEAQQLEELKQDTEFDHIIEDVERLVRSCIKAIDKIKHVSEELKKVASTERPASSRPR